MRNSIKAEMFFEVLGLRTEEQCPIQSHICDIFSDSEYDGADSLVKDLQLAHYSAGSFGLIYTYEIENCLNREDWRDAIDEVLEEYFDATGDKFEIERLSDALVLALDWISNNLSYRIESVRYWLVTEAVDSMDPSPEQYLFATEAEAIEHVSESLSTRLDYIVQHSPYPISEAELEALEQQEAALIKIEEV
jgi:hypothetical protein